MRHPKRIAFGLIVLFAVQAWGAAAAVAARGSCCPPAAEARSEGGPPPCRTLAPAGCCQERTAPTTSDPGQGSSQALASVGAFTAAPAAELPAPRTLLHRRNDVRVLRSVVLRL